MRSPKSFQLFHARSPTTDYLRDSFALRWLDASSYQTTHTASGANARNDIAAHTSVMAGMQDVFHEPHTNMSPPHSLPRDRGTLSSNFITTSSKHVLLILAWCPSPHAESYNKQRTQLLQMHTDWKIEKWKGMSWPRPEKDLGET
eukprot:scaffold170988_cov92-Attheya_sp.AAC.2